jgi:hypothetical protein
MRYIVSSVTLFINPSIYRMDIMGMYIYINGMDIWKQARKDTHICLNLASLAVPASAP